eukprot:9663009-Alexandrium_andersonii.AAC.1
MPRRRLSAGCPKCNPQSAQGPSGLQSALIRNLPLRKRAIDSGIRHLNGAGPRTASRSGA